jgi:hypothetical protein
MNECEMFKISGVSKNIPHASFLSHDTVSLFDSRRGRLIGRNPGSCMQAPKLAFLNLGQCIVRPLRPIRHWNAAMRPLRMISARAQTTACQLSGTWNTGSANAQKQLELRRRLSRHLAWTGSRNTVSNAVQQRPELPNAYLSMCLGTIAPSSDHLQTAVPRSKQPSTGLVSVHAGDVAACGLRMTNKETPPCLARRRAY